MSDPPDDIPRPSPPTDPVLARRALIATAVRIGKIGGYGLYLLACVFFVVLMLTKPSETLTALIVGPLAVGSLLLAPAIVFGYAVKAAEREDRKSAAAAVARNARDDDPAA